MNKNNNYNDDGWLMIDDWWAHYEPLLRIENDLWIIIKNSPAAKTSGFWGSAAKSRSGCTTAGGNTLFFCQRFITRIIRLYNKTDRPKLTTESCYYEPCKISYIKLDIYNTSIFYQHRSTFEEKVQQILRTKTFPFHFIEKGTLLEINYLLWLKE